MSLAHETSLVVVPRRKSMKDSMIFGNMRWVRCLVLVALALALVTSPGFGQESSEIEELRALLEALEARVAVLEDEGDPERAAEIAEKTMDLQPGDAMP